MRLTLAGLLPILVQLHSVRSLLFTQHLLAVLLKLSLPCKPQVVMSHRLDDPSALLSLLQQWTAPPEVKSSRGFFHHYGFRLTLITPHFCTLLQPPACAVCWRQHMTCSFPLSIAIRFCAACHGQAVPYRCPGTAPEIPGKLPGRAPHAGGHAGSGVPVCAPAYLHVRRLPLAALAPSPGMTLATRVLTANCSAHFLKRRKRRPAQLLSCPSLAQSSQRSDELMSVFATALAMLDKVHLLVIKRFNDKFLSFALAVPSDGSLRGPSLQEILSADRAVWQAVHALIRDHSWSLSDSLNEVAFCRQTSRLLCNPVASGEPPPKAHQVRPGCRPRPSASQS